jgi:hypothetical protein
MAEIAALKAYWQHMHISRGRVAPLAEFHISPVFVQPNPGDGSHGTAASFEAARTAFESAWSVFLAKRTEADFLEYRRHRASTAWKYAMWDAGCKLPTQTADGRARCFCGVDIMIKNTPMPPKSRMPFGCRANCATGTLIATVKPDTPDLPKPT